MNAVAPSKPYIIGSILLGADEFVSALVASRIPEMRGKTFDRFTTLGVVRNGDLVGGVVYHAYYGHDVQVSIACDRPAFMPWRVLFSYPFEQMGVSRITAIVSRKNKRARKFAIALGFKLEGVHPRGVDGIEDAFSFGMLREHCRWLKDRKNGQEIRSSSTAAA